jgi:general secretion pathway protein K
MSVRQRDDAGTQSGFILVSVLWTLALVGLITATLIKTVNLDIRAKANLTQQAQAASLSEGIARITAHDVATGRWQLSSSTTQSCRVGDYAARIDVTDLAGLVDINTAPFDLLQALLMGVGEPFEQARGVAGAIIEFRSPLQSGSSDSTNQQAGMRHAPKRAVFETVKELDQVAGMTSVLLDRLLPLVTVHSRSRGVDPTAAPAAVIAALSKSGSGPQPGGGPAVPPEFSARRSTRSFRVQVSVVHPSGARAGTQSTLELTPTQATGFILREWTRYQPTAAVTAQPAMADCFTDRL